jgi:CHAT domain-containing protein
MTAFHENLLQFHEPALALAETKRMFRDPVRLKKWADRQDDKAGDPKELTSPYYWAAFALVVRSTVSQ